MFCSCLSIDEQENPHHLLLQQIIERGNPPLSMLVPESRSLMFGMKQLLQAIDAMPLALPSLYSVRRYQAIHMCKAPRLLLASTFSVRNRGCYEHSESARPRSARIPIFEGKACVEWMALIAPRMSSPGIWRSSSSPNKPSLYLFNPVPPQPLSCIQEAAITQPILTPSPSHLNSSLGNTFIH